MSGGSRIHGGAPTTLEEVYEQFTPLLVSAVGSLARRGYDINPGEALDIIHDFYLEALPGLFDRFDPSQAKFSTYLYGAFLRFARPRIVRTAKWKTMLRPFDEAINVAAPVATKATSRKLEQRLTEAIAALPKPLKDVLDARLTKRQSERAIATRMAISRYVVRQRLAEALGRIAIAIGHDDTIHADARPLAVSLWRDQRSLMHVATEQGWTRHQAHAKYHSLIHSLSAAASALGEDS